MDFNALDCLLEYISAFEQDLKRDYFNASDDARMIIGAKLDVIEELINYAEENLGLCVRDNMFEV
jgi:hypothetical protein